MRIDFFFSIGFVVELLKLDLAKTGTLNMKTIAIQMAEYAEAFSYENIDSDTLNRLKSNILDTLGASIAAFDHPIVELTRQALTKYSSEQSGATLWGSQTRAHPTIAAFIIAL